MVQGLVNAAIVVAVALSLAGLMWVAQRFRGKLGRFLTGCVIVLAVGIALYVAIASGGGNLEPIRR